MDLKQLRSFIAVAETLHFQKAARRLNLSQPALSHRINQLEQFLDVRLFERNRRHVSLTAAGETLQPRAKAILEDWEAAVTETRTAGGRPPNLLRIGYIEYLNISAISTSIASFRSKHRAVTVEQVDLPPVEVLEALREGQLDLGFAVLPLNDRDFAVRTIVEGRWGLVVPCEHPLASHSSLELHQLDDLPLILFQRPLNPGVYDTWIERLKEAGTAANIVFETRQVQTALTMVQAGGGLFLASSYSTALLPNSLAWVPFTGFDSAISVGVVWNPERPSPLRRAYLSCLWEALT